MKRFSILLLAVLISTISHAQTFRVKVIGVSDGDTFTAINRDDLKLRFRLYGIDAPEKRQPFSNVSKKFLSSMILNKTIIVNVNSTDGWGRHIVKVSTQSVKDVSARMLEHGLAWHFKRYDNSKNYSQLEQKARERKIGLWKYSNPAPPWKLRRRK